MISSFSPLATLWNGVADSFSGGKLSLNRCIWMHVVIVYHWWVKWSDNGNMICSFSPLATLWTGVISSYSAGKLPLNRDIWAHVVILLDEWSDLIMLTLICSFSPLATLWNGLIHSYSGGKLPLNRHILMHVVIPYPCRVKWSDNGNMMCSFSPLATLWNGVADSFSGGKLSLNRDIWAHIVILLAKWSDVIMVTWFPPFPHLLHCETVQFAHTQAVSCFWIDIFVCM